MAWIKPKGYPKSQIDWAGRILTLDATTENEYLKAFEILENHRASHSYPMHIFKKRLKWTSENIDKNALTAQRLKRVPSIIRKLKREYHGRKATMKLSQMQDIGGCRAVLKTTALVTKLIDKYYSEKGNLKHERVRTKDYIKNPKEDGYRSVHLIYKYFSDKKNSPKATFNDLLIEVQIRSKLQHLWATAIETVDFFTRQAIKSNQGQKEWLDFFKLVSSAFAMLENCPLVPNIPTNEKELFLEIKRIEKELKVIKNLESWTRAINVIHAKKFKQSKRADLFLLELDILNERLIITTYTKTQEERAINDYTKTEKANTGKNYYDVVLVGIDDARDLQKTYPNYFADTKEFIVILKEIIGKYNGEK